MAYEKTEWIDHVTDPETEEVILQGTRFTAARMNKIEAGIEDVTGGVAALQADVTNYNKIDLTKQKLLDLDMVDIIQEKIAEGYNYFILPKGTRFNKTLVLLDLMFGLDVNQITFSGSGGFMEIELNTGGIGIVISGSDGINFDNVGLKSRGLPNPSTVGILQQRSAIRDACQFSKFSRLHIDMENIPSANGGVGTIGIYNNTAELATYHNIMVSADLPVVLTRSDIYNLSTIRRSLSLECVSFTGITSLIARSNHALLLDGVADVSIDNLYTTRDAYVGENNTQFAIAITGNDETGRENYNINIGCFENESFPSFLAVSGKARGLKAKGTQHVVETEVVTIAEYGQIVDGEIDIYVVTQPVGFYDLIKVESTSQGLYNVDIKISKTNETKAQITCDTTVVGCRTYSDSKPLIVVTHLATQSIISFFRDGIMRNGSVIFYSYGALPDASKGIGGSFAFNTNPMLGGNIGWFHDGAVFRPYGQLGYQQSAGTPVGVLTPRQIKEEAFDNVNKHWYKAVGLTSADWKQITN